MKNIQQIIKVLDEELISKNKSYLTLGQSNKILLEKDIISTSDKKNHILKKTLEEGEIPNSYQTKEKPKQWRITLSEKGKQKKIIVDEKKTKDRLEKLKESTFCPNCGVKLTIAKADVNFPTLLCLNCNNQFQNPNIKEFRKTNKNQSQLIGKVNGEFHNPNFKKKSTHNNKQIENKIKPVNVIIIILIGLFAIGYFSNSNYSPTVYTTQSGHIGAISEEVLDKFTEYSVHKDYAAVQQLINSGLIFTIPAGREVYVVESKFSRVKIRFKGETSEIWTVLETIQSNR